MKEKRNVTVAHICKTAILGLGLTFLINFQAFASPLFNAGIDLGAAGRTQDWAIFTLGTTLEDSSVFQGNATIFGNVGIAGTGNVILKGNVLVDGKVAYHTGGAFQQKGSVEIGDGAIQNAATDAVLGQGVLAATAASNDAYAMPASAGYPTTIDANESLSLSGSGKVVLKLTDFKLTDRSVLTLSGDASTAFIFNIENEFMINGKASVQFVGGLSWENVLFNVHGAGKDVELKSQAELQGIILAAERTVKLKKKAAVFGEIIANQIIASGGSQVTRPPIVSP